MDAASPFSAGIITSVGGTGRPSDVVILGDWDGREDLTADHSGLVDQTLDPGFLVRTRAAISEHTIANGFTENVFYSGDSFGNVYVSYSTDLNPPTGGLPASQVVVLNLPTLLNAFGTLNSDDQIVITGLAVNPVSDLTSFPNVNGGFSAFNGQIGEILYVSFWDTGGGLRTAGNGEIVRSGVLAFPISDLPSPAISPPGVQSDTGFPITVGGSFGVVFSVFDNLAGLAVDDDGSVYFQQVDLIQFTGANIVKITDTGTNQDRSGATSGFFTITTLNPANGNYGNASGPASQVNHFTNYSGTSKFFGNIAALAAGPGNVLYAAVAPSFIASRPATSGPFNNPPATPSLIISFADTLGGVGVCAGLPTGDGFADLTREKLKYIPGVSNFRSFVEGSGVGARGRRPAFGTVRDTLKVDFQVDYTIYSGLTVDEEGTVYVISGGTPAGVGRNPSPERGEILAFPDKAPADRRADFIDLRGQTLPRLPNSGGNAGDRKSDRYDHIFWMAPLDGMTATPTGVAGLARGFLLYLNRTRTDLSRFTNLPNGAAQGDDATDGPNVFADFDPGAQVAGGDDLDYPFLGGRYEFTLGGLCTAPQTDFFLNSNGNISFGTGDTSNIPSISSLAAGAARLAPAWGDLNPSSRGFATNTFPVQALGFTNVNTFAVRWIGVPTFGSETCGSSNNFSVLLSDDGTGLEEGNGTTPEGPTDLRWARKGGALVGSPPRPDHSGFFNFSYGRMDLLGGPGTPIVTGYSVGGLGSAPLETNLSVDGKALLGDGSQDMIYELFDAGSSAAPDFDLRDEGNSAILSTPAGQVDPNRGHLSFFGRVCTP
jgi:hypothetical protein